VGQSADPSRRERLRTARLYLVVEAAAVGGVLPAALEGGVDMVQLRDKAASDDELVDAGHAFRSACDEHGALLIVNDRPDLALSCGADGVHLGQDDLPVEEARREVGPDLLIGVSTHAREQVDAALATSADYVGVGPVYATATKPDVAPVGEALVAYAARRAAKPFFAIGGIDAHNVPAVLAAGAQRIAVVRAIRDAPDPRDAAAALRAALEREVPASAPQ